MVEFFQNIWNWFIANKDEIVLFFTSSNFIAFVTAIVMLVKQLKCSKQNNVTNESLKSSLDNATSVANKVVSIHDSTVETTEHLSTVQTNLKELEKETCDALDVIVQKLNAVLEVQSLVYSTVKDETIKKCINNILMDAKYVETATRATLEQELEVLKQKLSENIETIKDVVEDTSTKVKKVASNNKSSVPRY